MDNRVAHEAREARHHASQYATSDPTYAELMSTLAELGELLDTGRGEPHYERDCAELVTRVAELGTVRDAEDAQRDAIGWSNHTTGGHGNE